MSFLAKLELDGKTYNILEFRISLQQPVDNNGKPSMEPQGGTLFMVVESTNETDFFKWMISSTHTKNGQIIFYRRDAISKMRDIKFTKGYCVGYNEIFTSTTSMPMRIELVISAQAISMNGNEFKKNWPSEV